MSMIKLLLANLRDFWWFYVALVIPLGFVVGWS